MAKYLIQRRKGQRDHIYDWTPILAQKPDMFSISEEDAKAILENQKSGHHILVEAKPDKNVVVQPPAAEKRRIDMNDIIQPEGTKDDVQQIEEIEDVTDYDPNRDPVLRELYSLKTKNAVEGFALEHGYKLKRNKVTLMKDMQKEFTALHVHKMTELLQED
jgi:hypothetical protein